jgi:hypothetical protein
MNHTITASFDTLLSQSKSTAEDYFDSAKRVLDGAEIGYTSSDVIALAQIMAYDLRTSSMLVAAQKIENAIEISVNGIVESIDNVQFSADMIRDAIEEMKKHK